MKWIQKLLSICQLKDEATESLERHSLKVLCFGPMARVTNPSVYCCTDTGQWRGRQQPRSALTEYQDLDYNYFYWRLHQTLYTVTGFSAPFGYWLLVFWVLKILLTSKSYFHLIAFLVIKARISTPSSCYWANLDKFFPATNENCF